MGARGNVHMPACLRAYMLCSADTDGSNDPLPQCVSSYPPTCFGAAPDTAEEDAAAAVALLPPGYDESASPCVCVLHVPT